MSVNPEQQIQSIHVDGEPDLADLIKKILYNKLLISERGFDCIFERLSSGFAVEFSPKLERSEILCEAIF
jgi:hypothetical protein